MTAVSTDCEAGYYCPEGTTVSNPSDYICEAGYYCVAGVSAMASCSAG